MKGAVPLLSLHRLCPALHGASCAHVRTPQLTDPGSIHTPLLIAALCSPLGSRLKMIWTRSLVVVDQKVVQKGKLRFGEGRSPSLATWGWGGLEEGQSGMPSSTALRTRVLSPGSKDNAFLSNLKVYNPSLTREGEDLVLNF